MSEHDYLVITLAATSADAGREHDKSFLRWRCGGCGSSGPGVPWTLPGLCIHCAARVVEVSAAAPRQTPLFDAAPLRRPPN